MPLTTSPDRVNQYPAPEAYAGHSGMMGRLPCSRHQRRRSHALPRPCVLEQPPPSLPCVGGATDCSSVDFVCQIQPPANPSTLVTQTSTRTIASTPTPPCFPPSLVLAPWWRGLRPTTAFWHDACRAVCALALLGQPSPEHNFCVPLFFFFPFATP